MLCYGVASCRHGTPCIDSQMARCIDRSCTASGTHETAPHHMAKRPPAGQDRGGQQHHRHRTRWKLDSKQRETPPVFNSTRESKTDKRPRQAGQAPRLPPVLLKPFNATTLLFHWPGRKRQGDKSKSQDSRGHNPHISTCVQQPRESTSLVLRQAGHRNRQADPAKKRKPTRTRPRPTPRRRARQ